VAVDLKISEIVDAHQLDRLGVLPDTVFV